MKQTAATTAIDFTSPQALVAAGLEVLAPEGDLTSPAALGQPRKLAAYQIIQTVFPEFRWAYARGRNGKPEVTFFNYPTIGGDKPSLRGLVAHALGAMSLDFNRPVIDPLWQPLLNVGQAGFELKKLIRRIGIDPPKEVVGAIAKWLMSALTGAKSTLVCPVCPAWEVDTEGRYTFAGVKDDVGLVAQRILIRLPAWQEYCQKWKLDVTFKVAIGDFEATESACDSVGISVEEFLARLRRSQQAFVKEAPVGLRLETPFITELGDWPSYYQEALDLLTINNYSGSLGWPASKFDKIVAARTSLYRRWMRAKKINVKEMLFKQAAEYAAIGKVVARIPDNPMILAADDSKMTPFWQALLTEPVALIYHQGEDY